MNDLQAQQGGLFRTGSTAENRDDRCVVGTILDLGRSWAASQAIAVLVGSERDSALLQVTQSVIERGTCDPT